MTASSFSRSAGRVVIIVGLLLATACGGLTVNTKTPSNDAVIHFNSSVQDAEVWVNGVFVRRIRELKTGMALSPGAHRIQVKHDRYHTYYLELTVEKRERRTIPVKLAEILP